MSQGSNPVFTNLLATKLKTVDKKLEEVYQAVQDPNETVLSWSNKILSCNPMFSGLRAMRFTTARSLLEASNPLFDLDAFYQIIQLGNNPNNTTVVFSGGGHKKEIFEFLKASSYQVLELFENEPVKWVPLDEKHLSLMTHPDPRW